ncbi:hypothetical protein MKW92_025153 [Papaver armeniacum]|nr:hypothetical protein MKW92_025153 [Papaver armeniacum]
MAPRVKRCPRNTVSNPGVASVASQSRVFGKDGDEEDSELIGVGEREIEPDSLKLHIESTHPGKFKAKLKRRTMEVTPSNSKTPKPRGSGT